MGKPFRVFLLVALFVFGSWNYVFAISAPSNPEEEITETTYDYIAVEFSWDRNSESEVGWYHLIYRCKENCSGGNASWVIQPTSGSRVSKLIVGGFEFSLPTLEKKYEWQVGACSSQAEGACAYSLAREFVTPRQPPPPAPPPGGGTPPPGGGGSVDLPRPIAAQNLDELFASIFNFLFVLSMSVGVLTIIYSAFQMLTARGDPRQVSQAKTIILWTVIALTIIVLAKGAPSIVKGLLGG